MCHIHICAHNLHLQMGPMYTYTHTHTHTHIYIYIYIHVPAVYVNLTHFSFKVPSSNCEKRLLAWSYLSVCPSVCPPTRLEPLNSHWTDIHAI